jgi:putative salt-induced outer membrane protein
MANRVLYPVPPIIHAIRTMSRRTLVLLLIALAAPLSAAAQSHASLVPSPDGAPDEGWSGKGELGLALSRGNTDSDSFIGKFDLAYSNAHRKDAFGASTQYASTGGIESARRYELHGTSGFRLDERSYVYGSLRNERDNFGTYEYQWTATTGYGYEAIRSDAQRLFFEAGPGYRFAKDQGTRSHRNEVIGRGLVDWSLKLTPTASLVDSVLVESGRENTYARNLFGVQVAMSRTLAMKAGLETRYNSQVDPGIEKTDNLTTVNLVYNFK